MVRASHALLAHGHVLWQYVDDLLAWLDRLSSQFAGWTVFDLGIPMSWQLAALSQEVGWISSWSTSVLPDKLQRIIGQLEHISKCARPSEEPAVSHWQTAMAHLGMALLETVADPVI